MVNWQGNFSDFGVTLLVTFITFKLLMISKVLCYWFIFAYYPNIVSTNALCASGCNHS